MSIWKRCLHTVQVGHLSGQLGKRKGTLGCDGGQPDGQCCLRGCVVGVGTNPHLSGVAHLYPHSPHLVAFSLGGKSCRNWQQ